MSFIVRFMLQSIGACVRSKRLLVGIVVLLFLQAGPAQAATGDVLVVAVKNARGVDAILDGLRRPQSNAGSLRDKPLRVDVFWLERGQPSITAARTLKDRLKQYRVVFAASTDIARAIQREDQKVPIVFKGEDDPVSTCLVDTMKRPGRNATGYVDYLPDDDLKLMESLVLAYPRVNTVYVMVDHENFYVPDCGPLSRDPKPEAGLCIHGVREPSPELEWMQETPALIAHGHRLGVKVKFMLLCGPADFLRFVHLERSNPGVGFMFSLHALFWRHAKELVSQVAHSGRPAIYGRMMFARVGGLMALEPLLDEVDDKATVEMVRQVLGGRSPATMPVQVPRGFRLILNVDAAAAQRLHPSLEALHRADVILQSGTR